MNSSVHPFISSFSRYCRTRCIAAAALSILAIGLVQGCSSTPPSSSAPAAAAAPASNQFLSPNEAVVALVAAVRANDRDQLTRVLGEDSDKIISSGDDVADQRARDAFVQDYDEKHSLQSNDDGSITLLVGNQDWPSPIPLVKDATTGTWSFDSKAGEQEILNRRIGRNELNVIKVCQAIDDAQHEYAERDPDGDGIPEYAQKFISDPGKKNGLYWETAEGETPSPLGPLVANAVEEGYPIPQSGVHSAYQGYHYRMLLSQGPNAQGGAQDFVINGKMIGGFAAVAFPAEYGNSGIMTFMVDYHGDVYQKDLGPSTEQLATSMTTFDPDISWQKVDTTDTTQP